VLKKSWIKVNKTAYNNCKCVSCDEERKGGRVIAIPWLAADIFFFYIIKCYYSPVIGLGGWEDHIIFQHFLSISFILFSPFHDHPNLTSSLYSYTTGVDFPFGSFTCHTDQTVKYSNLHSYTDNITKPELYYRWY